MYPLARVPIDRRRLLRSLPATLAVFFVLAVYVFFASAGTWAFRRVPWWRPGDAPAAGYYGGLTEGFLRGQLHMAQTAEPRLAELKDPYDYGARHSPYELFYLWDASYYNGKYYLYFTPLPALMFYLPYRLVGKSYPPDALAAVFFCAWALLAAVAFVRRARSHAARTYVPLPLWVLMIGLGNVISFLLTEIRTYEVAIMSGMAFTATWACALLRFVETGSRRHAFWMAFWLALSIAARPNLGVLLLITAVVIVRVVRERRALLRVAAAAFAPLAVVAILLIAYNLARFGKPFEFGVTYQLTFVSMQKWRVCGFCTGPEFVRVVNSAIHYLFWGVTVGSEFPFVDLMRNHLDPAVAFPGGAEQIAGVAALIPLTMLGTFFALIFALMRDRERDAGVRAATSVMAAAWLALLGLSACWWVTARYSLDFMMLMSMSAAVLIEGGLSFLAANGVSLRPIRVAVIVLVLYSATVGFFAGFMGTNEAFRRSNRELFEKLHTTLSYKKAAPK